MTNETNRTDCPMCAFNFEVPQPEGDTIPGPVYPDPVTWLATLRAAIDRCTLTDVEGDEVNTAMAWIEEALDLPTLTDDPDVVAVALRMLGYEVHEDGEMWVLEYDNLALSVIDLDQDALPDSTTSEFRVTSTIIEDDTTGEPLEIDSTSLSSLFEVIAWTFDQTGEHRSSAEVHTIIDNAGREA